MLKWRVSKLDKRRSIWLIVDLIMMGVMTAKSMYIILIIVDRVVFEGKTCRK